MSSLPTCPRPGASPRRQRRLDRKQRRRRTRKAHAARRQLRRLHQQLPEPARSLLEALAGSFTRPTFLRFVVLALATILTVGQRTVCNLLRTLGALAPGHPSSYHRVFCQRRWSCWRLAHGLADWVFDHLVPEGRVQLAGDDTVDGHKGAKVFGKGCHRDPVRSTHSLTVFRWGHKWVVLAVLVRFPFTRRQWALPLLVALYRTEKDNTQAGRRHKTPARLLRQLSCVLLRWFPQRSFVLAGDGNYGSHEMARFARRRRGRLTLVSKFYPDARLYEPPPPYAGHGRPRVKGAKFVSVGLEVGHFIGLWRGRPMLVDLGQRIGPLVPQPMPILLSDELSFTSWRVAAARFTLEGCCIRVKASRREQTLASET